MKRTPRIDLQQVDKTGVKAYLSKYANAEYQQLWIEAGCPENIIIGDHSFKCDESNWIKIYGPKSSYNYDGIHMRASKGKSTYTSSVVGTFQRAFPDLLKTAQIKSPSNIRDQSPNSNFYYQKPLTAPNNIQLRSNQYPKINPWQASEALMPQWSTVVKSRNTSINPWQTSQATLPLYNRWEMFTNSEN